VKLLGKLFAVDGSFAVRELEVFSRFLVLATLRGLQKAEHRSVGSASSQGISNFLSVRFNVGSALIR
jgi:hypothetical protein